MLAKASPTSPNYSPLQRRPGEFEKFVNGVGDDPFTPAVGYNTMFLSEWGKLGFNQVDYTNKKIYWLLWKLVDY